MFEMYERIIKVVSAILAICCMTFLFHVEEIFKQAERYPVKEEEYVSLENYAIETAKKLKEDVKISEEEIARRKNDNYKVVEKRYSNDKFFVKVESDIAEVEAAIPASIIEKERDANTVYFKMTLKYNEATYTRKATVHNYIECTVMFVIMTVMLGIMWFGILYFIGMIVAGIILLIEWIIKKIKKQ